MKDISLSDKLAFSIPQAARVTGISMNTLYDEARIGRLRTFKVGGRKHVSRAALEEWMAQREKDASGSDPSLAAMR